MISIGDKEIRFLSFDSFKIAINSFSLDDNSYIFFILRINSDYTDNIVQYTLNRITDIIFFILGDKYKKDTEILEIYLKNEGNKIIDTVLNATKLNSIRYNITFPSVDKIKCVNGSDVIPTLMCSIQKFSSQIWGISCFVDQKLLVSQIPISICTLFQYIPDREDKFEVFLNKFQRKQIIQTPAYNSSIPDLDIIPSLVLVYRDSVKKITFYVLVDPLFIKQDMLVTKVKESIEISFPFIYNNAKNLIPEESVPNTINYDSYLLDLSAIKSTDSCEENFLMIRDAFLNDNRLTEILMKNPKNLTIGYRIIPLEYYSFTEDNGKHNFLKLYQKCINLNSSLKKYIETFSPNESS